MPRFLIISSQSNCGRGARGANLLRFLRTFLGRRAVEMITPADLEQGPARQTDFLMLGMPTTLQPDHLTKVRFRRVALFDYSDVGGPTWSPESEAWLRSLTDLYLKPCVEDFWDFGLRWGVLPIRRYPGLTWHVKLLRRLFPRRFPDLFRRDHDLSFLGNCTAYRGLNADDRYYQRIDWLREVQQSGNGFSFWGGLQLSANQQQRLQHEFPDLSGLQAPSRRLLFSEFFYHLLRSKIVLTPAGNARWSYRHYEAIYAGALLVSTDFRRVRTLIPLPLQNMIHVDDHAPVLPAIGAALQRFEQEPHLRQQNIDFLETYLQDGDYCRHKDRLMEEFLAQLTASSGIGVGDGATDARQPGTADAAFDGRRAASACSQ